MKKILGIIAEYNPYHNGHRYQMEEAKLYTRSDYVIVLLSGHFVQRGEPAIYDTFVRTKMALLSGADAVFEMPSAFSTSGAEDFAAYGISLFSSLGLSYFSFGAENATALELGRIAGILAEEGEEFKEALRMQLCRGESYPRARANALLWELKRRGAQGEELKRVQELMATPNNVLGIEYMKAKYRLRSPIQALAIPRNGAGYHHPSLDEDIGFASASAIRRHILSKGDLLSVRIFVPTDTFAILQNARPLSADAFTGSVFRRVLSLLHDGFDLEEFSDVSADLAKRIKSSIRASASYEELIGRIKTKQITYTRISRALCHILLGIRSSRMQKYKQGRFAPYAKLLGFRKESADLLTELKKTSSIPILSKMADAGAVLDEDPQALSLLMDEVHAAEMYNSVYFDEYHEELPNIYTRPMVIV